jgi:hypothetical protein
MSCEYCGNRSGKIDDRGNCISCGGPIERQMGHEVDNFQYGTGMAVHGSMSRIETLGYIMSWSSAEPDAPDMIFHRAKVKLYDDRFGGIVQVE